MAIDDRAARKEEKSRGGELKFFPSFSYKSISNDNDKVY